MFLKRTKVLRVLRFDWSKIDDPRTFLKKKYKNVIISIFKTGSRKICCIPYAINFINISAAL